MGRGDERTGGPRRRSEREVQADWATGRYRGATLATRAGESYTVVYEGRRGGPAGPDFRDAVFATASGRRVYGDVEIHLDARGWAAHGHAGDPRYDGVIVHLVVAPAREEASPLASGARAPIATLGPPARLTARLRREWPCVGLAARMPGDELRALLREAGMRRFREKARPFEEALRLAGDPDEQRRPWGPADALLWLALAEAMGYGRDRAALREAGGALLRAREWAAAEGAGRELPRVEGARARGLAELRRRWDVTGPWEALRRALHVEDARRSVAALVEAVAVRPRAIPRGRALIALANVALPYAAARAAVEGGAGLAARAERAYQALPGLPSNAITRLMARQLGLARLPPRAVEHQGLQHLWAAHCRRKECAACPCGSGCDGATGRSRPEEWEGGSQVGSLHRADCDDLSRGLMS